MADNVPITPGSGATIATDDVGGVQYQRVKLVDGTLDSSAAIPGDATNGLDVDVTRLPSGSSAAQAAKTADFDTSAGTDTVAMVGIALPKSGGAVAGGTTTDPVRVDPTGTTAQPVTDGGGSLTVDHAETLTSGTITATGQTVAPPIGAGQGAVAFQLSGTWTSSLVIEGSVDGTNYFTLNSYSLNLRDVNTVANLTNGIYVVAVAGLASVRVRSTLHTSGTVTVSAHACVGASPIFLGTTLPTGSSLIGATTPKTAAGTEIAVPDNGGFADGTTPVTPAGFIFDETAGTALTENDTGAARMDSKRAQVCVLEDETTRGQRATVTSGKALKVDGSAVTQPISDASQLADNAGFTDGTSKVLPAGFVFDETAGTALTENDVGAARMSANRALVCTVEDDGTRGRRLALKAASTAAVAADVAAVVALSPNNNSVANALFVRPRTLESYLASYRLVNSTGGQLSLTFTFTANTDKQLATIYHTAAATKIVRLRKVSVFLSTLAAGVFGLELKRLSASTAPATGNPAITPIQDDITSTVAAEATCLALPGTAGSVASTDSPASGHFEINAAAAAAQANPSGAAGQEIVLYEYKPGREKKPLIMRASTAEGYAVVGRCTAGVALRFTVMIEFTEE